MSIKAVVKRAWLPLKILEAKCLGRLIYKPQYLKGKYFESNSKGWMWVADNFIWQSLFAMNRGVPWPVSPRVIVANWKNIDFHVDDLHIFQTSGTYFQALDAKIIIGKGTWIAPNVGLITTNHDMLDPAAHVPGQDIRIGEACWIGMNAVILPGVTLGPHTTVGAGAVVTKSFPEGYCVIGGVPAKSIKSLKESAQ